jgi:O-antigen/teichoic acid export membrane protein
MLSSMNNLGKKIRRGISWNAAGLSLTKGISILIRLLLARVIAPESFGLIAMVVVSLSLVSILAEMGLQTALIQRQRDVRSRLRYDSAFWLLAFAGVSWMVVMWLVGMPLMAFLYQEPRLILLGIVMSLTIPIQNLTIVPVVRLTRLMRFKSIVIAELCGTAFGALVAVGLAFGGADVWALAGQQLVSTGLTMAIIWHFCLWRPRPRFDWSTIADLKHYSVFMLGNRMVYYLRANIDYLFIGAILGPASLGIYTLAYTFTENLRTSAAAIINRVTLPAYSQLQQRPAELELYYLKVTRGMTLGLFPISLTLLLYAEPIVLFALTDAWTETILPIRILSGAGLVYAALGPCAEVLQGIGKPDALFRISLLNLLVLAAPLIGSLAWFYGLPGAASAVLFAFTAMRIGTYIALRRFLPMSWVKLVGAAFPALAATLAVIAAWYLLATLAAVPVLVAGNFLVFAMVASVVYGRKRFNILIS